MIGKFAAFVTFRGPLLDNKDENKLNIKCSKLCKMTSLGDNEMGVNNKFTVECRMRLFGYFLYYSSLNQ